MHFTTTEALAITLLVALSALFSGMETALVSLSEVKLRASVQAGEILPRLLRLWLERPNDVLASLLIGNNTVNITAGALATDLTERLLRGTPYAGWGIPIAVGATTLAILIFGEVAPKTFAKHNPDRYLKLLPLVQVAYVLFYPLTRVLVRITGAVVGWMGGEVESARPHITEEDIEDMVRLGEIEGSIAPEATRRLTGVLELDEKVAREIMVPRLDVHAIPVDASIAEVIDQVTHSGFSRYPIFEGTVDRVVGVLYVKDLLAAVLERGSEAVVLRELMRRPMIVPESVPLPALLVLMKRDRVHLAVIASEYGGVAGIATLEDIVEEVFGDIYDEHDVEAAPIRAVEEGGWLVAGVVTISDLEDAIGVPLDDDGGDFETVAGMLMKFAGRVPEVGFICEWRGIRFEVRRADATGVLEVAAEVQPAALGEDASIGDEVGRRHSLTHS